MKTQLREAIKIALEKQGIENPAVHVEGTVNPQFGDYTSNAAMIAAKKLGRSPQELAQGTVSMLQSMSLPVSKIETAGPGFINFTLNEEILLHNANKIVKGEKLRATESKLSGKKVMVEYAHPNTHKEMHIGHMRTLITGESLARLAEAAGAEVFRANYQGDIGLHVAKAIFGVKLLLEEQQLTLEEVAKRNHFDKAHFLGLSYARGSQEYDAHKAEIDQINKDIYNIIGHPGAPLSGAIGSMNIGDSIASLQNDNVGALYHITRQWSLDYFADFYKRFYTKFDQLFFESQSFDLGVKVVKENIGKVFEEQNGAVVFPGEKHGLHTRVFITGQGNPTYEGKDMGLGFIEYETFPFDLCMHIVGSEQLGYFQVVIKALELIDPEKFGGKEYHLPMGMVQLKDRKMSSRTGDVLTVNWLLDQVKERVEQLASEGRIATAQKEKTIEQITVGAVKYSVLKVGATQDVSFDIETSVSMDGNSGPYLQYTYARTQSVLRKAGKMENGKWKMRPHEVDSPLVGENGKLEPEELALLRLMSKFEETVIEAAEKYSPSILANYLFELAQAFNLFYQKVTILKSEGETKTFRVGLTAAVGQTIKTGLNLLGIEAPEQM
jgi:arginyl-tRNA synthetase